MKSRRGNQKKDRQAHAKIPAIYMSKRAIQTNRIVFYWFHLIHKMATPCAVARRESERES